MSLEDWKSILILNLENLNNSVLDILNFLQTI